MIFFFLLLLLPNSQDTSHTGGGEEEDDDDDDDDDDGDDDDTNIHAKVSSSVCIQHLAIPSCCFFFNDFLSSFLAIEWM
jgi:hypothetical protein